MKADMEDKQDEMEQLIKDEVRAWRLYPKRNLEGHYKFTMWHGTTDTFLYR
jgi:hypothetical protein